MATPFYLFQWDYLQVLGWAANISGQIKDGMRICGENMFAVHSIKYDKLPSYFLGFSV